jgi:AcrR family transcriptional regulator
MKPTSEAAPRWRRRPTERPQELLDAALVVFSEHGLARARVEDIAARAGVSKGTVYLYFDSKEELFREAVRDRTARAIETLEAAAPPGDPVARIQRFIDAYWKHLRGPMFGGMYRLILAELPRFPEFTQFYGEEVSGKVISLAAEIVREGQEQGRLRGADPMVAARMIVGLIVQHAIWTSQPTLFPRIGNRSDAELGSEITDFLMAALLNPAGTTDASTTPVTVHAD